MCSARNFPGFHHEDSHTPWDSLGSPAPSKTCCPCCHPLASPKLTSASMSECHLAIPDILQSSTAFLKGFSQTPQAVCRGLPEGRADTHLLLCSQTSILHSASRGAATASLGAEAVSQPAWAAASPHPTLLWRACSGLGTGLCNLLYSLEEEQWENSVRTHFRASF